MVSCLLNRTHTLLKKALVIVLMVSWWCMLIKKASLANCFNSCEHYWDIYVTALYPLKTGCMSLFVSQGFKATK